MAENISAEKVLVIDDRVFLGNLNQTMLELEGTDLNGIGISDVTFRFRAISDASDFRCRQRLDAGPFSHLFIDKQACRAGIKQQSPGLAVYLYLQAVTMKMLRVSHLSFQSGLGSRKLAHQFSRLL